MLLTLEDDQRNLRGGEGTVRGEGVWRGRGGGMVCSHLEVPVGHDEDDREDEV